MRPEFLKGKIMSKTTLFTSESVCAGHPDKICDQISDAIVDAALAKDPHSRCGIETVAGANQICLFGEIKTNTLIDYEKVARDTIKRLGYTVPAWGFSQESSFSNDIHEQSPEIAMGVDQDGAGDQGMMFGYASNETKELMPLPIMLAHRLAMGIDKLRESRRLPYLRPDGKTQVTTGYEKNIPKTIENVVLAVPHSEKIKLVQVKEDLYNLLVVPILKEYGFKINREQLIVNGTGVWHIGGPASDTGVTGRKIIVDTYGGMARQGGGAFSGKDPTKVDRSAAYAARYLAKNIVANKLADRCEVRLAYFIGAKKPVMQETETFGTEKKSAKIINGFADKLLDTSLQGIIDGLNLRRPIYLKTAAYGHFGRDIFPWEKIKKI